MRATFSLRFGFEWRRFGVWANGETVGFRVGDTGQPFFLMVTRSYKPYPVSRTNLRVANPMWRVRLIVGTDPCAPIARTCAPWATWRTKLRVWAMRPVDREWLWRWPQLEVEVPA